MVPHVTPETNRFNNIFLKFIKKFLYVYNSKLTHDIHLKLSILELFFWMVLGFKLNL